MVHSYLWIKMEKTIKIGLVASAFDLLHPGHITLLKDAHNHCDYLIAALHTDPRIERPTKNKPLQSTLERYIQLEGCRYVDDIVPYDTEQDLLNLLIIKNVNIIFLGLEYQDTEYTGKSLDIEVGFHPRTHTYSSSELRERINNSVLV